MDVFETGLLKVARRVSRFAGIMVFRSRSEKVYDLALVSFNSTKKRQHYFDILKAFFCRFQLSVCQNNVAAFSCCCKVLQYQQTILLVSPDIL